MDITVERVGLEQTRLLSAIGARAFWDDPLFNAFQPDLLRQHRSLHGFCASVLDDSARVGEVWAARVGNRVVGAAAWLPPGVRPATGGMRAARSARHILPVLAMSNRRRGALKLLDALAEHHPHDEHWYLGLLVTDPLFQGRGVGTRLMQPTLERADEQGLPVYLETQKEANLAYYRRSRFEVTQVIEVPTCPPVWTMTRPPA